MSSNVDSNNISSNETSSNKKKSKKPIIFVVVLILVLAAIGIGVFLISNIKTKVELDKYISISYEGYDTIGIATVSFDEKQFIKDYEKKIKMSDKFRDSYRYDELKEQGIKVKDNKGAEGLIYAAISYEVNSDSELSNGDTIILSWNCDDDCAAEYFNCEFICSELSFIVEGLEEAEIVDPFDFVEITYSGYSSLGTADVEYTGDISGLSFEIDNAESLSNGDTVQINLLYNDSLASETSIVDQGIILSEVSKDFIVDGLMEYITDLSLISDDAMKAMKKQAEDEIVANPPKGFDGGWSVESEEYLGVYFLTKKDMTTGKNKNILTLVYSVDAAYEFTTTTFADYSYVGGTRYLYPVTFTNIVLLPDGTVSVDTSQYSTTTNKISVEFEGTRNLFEHSWRFSGFDDFTSMYNQYITANVDDYEYVSTVDESTFELDTWWEFAE